MPEASMTARVLLLVFASCSLFAQQAKRTTRKHPTEQDQSAAPSIRLDRKYDKFRNVTMFHAAFIGVKPDDVDVLFAAMCAGNVEACRVDSNDDLSLGLYYTLSSANLEDTPVYLIIDGSREGDSLTGMGLGEVRFDSYTKNGIRHQLYMTVPTSLIVKIASAKSMEGQVSGQAFSLQQSHLDALKKFAHTLGWM